MKISNKCLYTQIRIDNKLRQLVRLRCAAESIPNRQDFCKKSFNHYINSEDRMLIASVNKGVLFRVELPLEEKDLIDKIVADKETTISRVLHSAIYLYVDEFMKSLPDDSRNLISKVYG